MNRKDVGIYVHIPFCKRKCRYCDFLSAPGDENAIREYIYVLLKEIGAHRKTAEDYRVRTIYIGGGTPSSIAPSYIREIRDRIFDVFDLSELEEFTIEVNPGTVDLEKLSTYREIGINRLSIGIQSAKDSELKKLGRIHTFNEAKECVLNARKAGFTNISVDLMSALPGQSLQDYRENIEEILKLEPTHISSYSLIIEEGTPFFDDYSEKGAHHDELPDEETDRAMYALTGQMLEEKGFHRYEISNYSKEGYESVHNSSYWTGTDYFGFGLGASSYINGTRYRNVSAMSSYLEAPLVHEEIEKLSLEDKMSEFMFLGLRMTKGIDTEEFQKRFGISIFDRYGKQLEKLFRLGLIEKAQKNRIRLTEFGLDVSNVVFEEFV